MESFQQTPKTIMILSKSVSGNQFLLFLKIDKIEKEINSFEIFLIEIDQSV